MKDRLNARDARPDPAPAEKIPVNAKVQREFQIAYWNDPRDGKRKQVWIPRVWLEYEDGSTKELEIEGLLNKQGLNLFPFPVKLDDGPEPADKEN